jgi:hypothetical protein
VAGLLGRDGELRRLDQLVAAARALAAGDHTDAEDSYRAALAEHGRCPGPAHLARSHLVYGEGLRRMRRPRDARAALREAHQLLTGIGADGFAERARAELATAGESRPAKAAARYGRDLTAQEAQVARLARKLQPPWTEGPADRILRARGMAPPAQCSASATPGQVCLSDDLVAPERYGNLALGAAR